MEACCDNLHNISDTQQRYYKFVHINYSFINFKIKKAFLTVISVVCCCVCKMRNENCFLGLDSSKISENFNFTYLLYHFLLDRQFYLIKEEGQAVVPADLDAIPIYISGRRKSAGTTGTTVGRINQLPLCNRTSNYSPRIGY
jgi:hypothetical protein